MQYNGLTRVVMVMAVMLSTSAKGEQQTLHPLEDDLLLPSESHQVPVVAEDDLQASATGYGGYAGGNFHKGYGSGNSFKGIRGQGGSHGNKEDFGALQRHHANKGHKGSHFGDHGEAQYTNHQLDQGRHSKGSDDRQTYAGDVHSGAKGGQNHHKGSKGHHDKGHKDEGFKNVYHKEEYSHSQDFYDDSDDKKYHSNFDDFDRYFDAHRGNDYKGGHYKGGHNQDAYGHRGHQQKAQHHDDHADYDDHYGDKALSGHKSLHGHRGGHQAHHGHGGHAGGFGHTGHVGKFIHGGHGAGYGHAGHLGGYGGHGTLYRPPIVLREAPRSYGSFGSFGRSGHAGFGHAGY